MNSIHDLGGMHGFGPIRYQINEPVFFKEWEKRVFGIAQAMTCQRFWSVDESRYACERMDPAVYLNASYYEKWLTAAEILVTEKGLLDLSEMEERIARLQRAPEEVKKLPQRQNPELAKRLVDSHRHAARQDLKPTSSPRFQPGDRVKTRNMHPEGHTRIPRYARDRRGRIQRIQGYFPLPDALVEGKHEACFVYTVEFSAKELWGEDASPSDKVLIDLWESYLEAEKV